MCGFGAEQVFRRRCAVCANEEETQRIDLELCVSVEYVHECHSSLWIHIGLYIAPRGVVHGFNIAIRIDYNV